MKHIQVTIFVVSCSSTLENYIPWLFNPEDIKETKDLHRAPQGEHRVPQREHRAPQSEHRSMQSWRGKSLFVQFNNLLHALVRATFCKFVV